MASRWVAAWFHAPPGIWERACGRMMSLWGNWPDAQLKIELRKHFYESWVLSYPQLSPFFLMVFKSSAFYRPSENTNRNQAAYFLHETNISTKEHRSDSWKLNISSSTFYASFLLMYWSFIGRNIWNFVAFWWQDKKIYIFFSSFSHLHLKMSWYFLVLSDLEIYELFSTNWSRETRVFVLLTWVLMCLNEHF